MMYSTVIRLLRTVALPPARTGAIQGELKAADPVVTRSAGTSGLAAIVAMFLSATSALGLVEETESMSGNLMILNEPAVALGSGADLDCLDDDEPAAAPRGPVLESETVPSAIPSNGCPAGVWWHRFEGNTGEDEEEGGVTIVWCRYTSSYTISYGIGIVATYRMCKYSGCGLTLTEEEANTGMN